MRIYAREKDTHRAVEKLKVPLNQIGTCETNLNFDLFFMWFCHNVTKAPSQTLGNLGN